MLACGIFLAWLLWSGIVGLIWWVRTCSFYKHLRKEIAEKWDNLLLKLLGISHHWVTWAVFFLLWWLLTLDLLFNNEIMCAFWRLFLSSSWCISSVIDFQIAYSFCASSPYYIKCLFIITFISVLFLMFTSSILMLLFLILAIYFFLFLLLNMDRVLWPFQCASLWCRWFSIFLNLIDFFVLIFKFLFFWVIHLDFALFLAS